jgi:hypothetical protein
MDMKSNPDTGHGHEKNITKHRQKFSIIVKIGVSQDRTGQSDSIVGQVNKDRTVGTGQQEHDKKKGTPDWTARTEKLRHKPYNSTKNWPNLNSLHRYAF